MELNIFDVSHGFCAYLIADNNNVILFDCGHNEHTGFRPSAYLRGKCSAIEYFIIHNFDQDHISDLPEILNYRIVGLYRNPSIPSSHLKALKPDMSPEMSAAIYMHETWTTDLPNPPSLQGIEIAIFYNRYPLFTDTNNLSVVAFIHYDGMGIVIPGDLEKAGWESLLQRQEFQEHLRRTNIFVASHHGRESGYCKSVFDYCSPHVIIISDKEIIHETQKNTYSQHASGITWNGGPQKRFVLTTRSDGDLKIRKSIGSGYYINTSC
jgi:beta-lactamase superfamily II metal-dependent hydrolase